MFFMGKVNSLKKMMLLGEAYRLLLFCRLVIIYGISDMEIFFKNNKGANLLEKKLVEKI